MTDTGRLSRKSNSPSQILSRTYYRV